MIEITTLADEQRVFMADITDVQMDYLATCVIVTEITMGIFHNYCICKAVPAELVKSLPFKGLREMLEKDTVMYLKEKNVTVRTRCFVAPNRERLFQYVKKWLTDMSFNDEIDYTWG